MVLEWVAYSATKSGLKLTMETLEQFEHDVKCVFVKAKSLAVAVAV